MGQVAQQHDRLKERLARIGSVFAVMSGKGGVGKSTVTACLADGLTRLGVRTGVLDADLNGPCMARMMGVKDHKPSPQNGAMIAARNAYGVPVMSMDMFLPEDETPLIWEASSQQGAYTWRSMVEMSALRELLSDTDWGDLDVLLIDLPPGAERLQNLADLLPDLTGAIVVSTASQTAMTVVSRSILMALNVADVRIAGVVENMSTMICSECGCKEQMFIGAETVEELAERHSVPYLGAIPFNITLADHLETGRSYIEAHAGHPAAHAILDVAKRVHFWLKGQSK